MESIVYKVVENVKNHDDKTETLYSACQNKFILPKTCKLIYKLRETIYPKIPNSKIFCFLDYHSAVLFAKDMCGINKKIEIYKGLGLNPKPLEFRSSGYVTIQQWWEEQAEPVEIRNKDNSTKTPINTFGVDSIYLTQLVWSHFEVLV